MLIKKFKPSIKDIAPLIIESVNSGKDVRLTITGYSMYPILRGGSDDIILTAPDNLKKYDVVLFKRENGDYIFHRIIAIHDDCYTIAGDNETKKEFPVYKKDVTAKMKAFVRSGKTYRADNVFYMLYSRLWLLIFPARHVAAKFLHSTAGLYRKIFTKG